MLTVNEPGVRKNSAFRLGKRQTARCLPVKSGPVLRFFRPAAVQTAYVFGLSESDVRITGGTLKNRLVPVVARPGLRPTSSRVREAIFHRLIGRLQGARVWDAFAGSGILALEAWSRGAEVVVCTERDRQAAHQIRKTVGQLGANIDVRSRDARRMSAEDFAVIFADPPYDQAPEPWLRVLAPALAPGGVLVFEHRTGALRRGRHGELQVTWQRRYGDTSVSFLEHSLLPSGNVERADRTPLKPDPVS
ncbi:MAG: 16S rRNA (guanine(966)-N(2))-methyltransferase RsmD [Deltaproteobacteria bacterium]|nr:16S rRNA (guanine(966)-N(2))-methyltransferase RsmD [Deltaproteobacteria bacterium]